MNSPALHSFNGPKLGNRAPVSIEKNKELESRIYEMGEWQKKLVALMKNRAILQWMDFDIAEYADIIFATQMGNVRMNYNEELFDSGEKSAFNKQKESSLGDFEEFMQRLGNAKNTFHTHVDSTFSLLENTINITQMINISPPHTVLSEIRESDGNYNILSKQCRELFMAGKILIDANRALSSFSLDTIANLINIRIFRNARITRTALNTFYRSEEVRIFLSGEYNQSKESPIAQCRCSLEEARDKIRELNGRVDALKRDTNFVICYEVLAPRYIETIVEQTNMVGEILQKYEKKIWKQEDILRKFSRMIESVDFSKDLLQVFVAIENIAKEYGKNISLLSDGYNMIKGLKDVKDIIVKLNLLCVRIKKGLIEKLLYEYQSNPRFDLNPAVSVSEAIKDTRENRGPLQRIYHALVRLVLEKDAFNEKLMADIVASHNKTVSIDWKNKYKVSLHKSAEAKLFEYQKHPFYNEMVETLKKAFEIYIEKVENYIKDFSDSSWGVEDKKESGDKKEKETLASLLERTVKRVAEKKV